MIPYRFFFLQFWQTSHSDSWQEIHVQMKVNSGMYLIHYAHHEEQLPPSLTLGYQTVREWNPGRAMPTALDWVGWPRRRRWGSLVLNVTERLRTVNSGSVPCYHIKRRRNILIWYWEKKEWKETQLNKISSCVHGWFCIQVILMSAGVCLKIDLWRELVVITTSYVCNVWRTQFGSTFSNTNSYPCLMQWENLDHRKQSHADEALLFA